MGFSEAVNTVLRKKYATFSGRASRSEFWWFMLFNWLVLAVLTGLLGIGYSLFENQLLVLIFGAPVVLFFLGTLIPSLAVNVRRFHDRNISGWVWLGMVVLSNIPYVGFLLSIAMLVIEILKGTEGPNRYGDDPLRPRAMAEVFA